MLLSEVRKTIDQTLTTLGWKGVRFEVWVSANAQNGHCFSNVAMVVAARYRRPITDVSQQLINTLQTNTTYFQKIVWKNNFLNLFFQPVVFNDVVNTILRSKKCGYSSTKQGKINYEWVSANPTGFLHLGHARNVFVGQAIVNLLQFSGYDVSREFYINDSGNQIWQLGRTVYYHYQKLIANPIAEFEQMYRNPELVLAAKTIVANDGKKYAGTDFLQDFKVQSFFINFSKDFFLKQMHSDLTSWGINFDRWFSEKSLLTKTKLTTFLARLKTKKMTYEKDGALWVSLDANDRSQDFVLLKKSGETTYFVGDIMYHIDKFERGYDQIINIFGADHHHHYLKLRAVLAKLNYDVSNFATDLLQMVKIVVDKTEVKISKRKGTSVYLSDLVKTTGINFLRFMLMSRQRGTKFSFDVNLASKKDASNPFFYVQYAYARACQLLAKTHQQFSAQSQQYQLLNTVDEQNLLLQLHHLHGVLTKATTKREPQTLVHYLLKISKSFHVFYENTSVLQSSPTLKQERTDLVLAFSRVMETVAQLLGITLKKQM